MTPFAKPALLGAALFISACSGASETPQTVEAVRLVETPVTDTALTDADMTDAAMMDDAVIETRTKAVLIYADWCGSCKVLDPKVKAVRAAGPMDGVEFVTLDYTNRDADAFYAQAAEHGVEIAVRAELADGIKTGWLLLVDFDDERVLSKVTRTDSEAEITAKIEQALAAS